MSEENKIEKSEQRQKLEDIICATFLALDGTGEASEKLVSKFSEMNDDEFNVFCKQFFSGQQELIKQYDDIMNDSMKR